MQIGILKNTVTVELCQQLLVQLKVPAMANAFAKLATDPVHQNMTLVEAVATMASLNFPRAIFRASPSPFGQKIQPAAH